MVTFQEMMESKQQTRLKSDAIRAQARMAKPAPENPWIAHQERKEAAKVAEVARQGRVKEFKELRSHTYDNAERLDSNLVDAARRGDKVKVIELLELGADPCAKDENGTTAPFVAYCSSHPDVAHIIFNRARELYPDFSVWDGISKTYKLS